MGKILKEPNRFVCINANKINYLIPSSKVLSSFYCSADSCFKDGKIIIKNRQLPFVNFLNNNNSNIEYFGDLSNSSTALIVKNKCLFDNVSEFALITSKECSVIDINYKDFSLFGDFFESILKKIGYIACYYHSDSIYYLVDIEVFLKNFIL